MGCNKCKKRAPRRLCSEPALQPADVHGLNIMPVISVFNDESSNLSLPSVI
jgi:hypothetical protein